MSYVKEKIQIRRINDMHGNSYLIYDYMTLTYWNLWKSKCVYETLEDALRFKNKNILVEDISK